MVVLQVKSTAYASSPSPPEAEVEETEFLYECAASTAVADVATALGALAGLQARLLSLCLRIRLRERCADSGAAGELERALDEAEAYASKEQVQHNRFLSPHALREHIKNIEKKFATSLQESLETLSTHQPSSDNENGEIVSGKNENGKIELWWAGKKLAMGQRLCDYIGVNDKTKIVIRLTRAADEPDCPSTLE